MSEDLALITDAEPSRCRPEDGFAAEGVTAMMFERPIAAEVRAEAPR
jgi:hypothetical protein